MAVLARFRPTTPQPGIGVQQDHPPCRPISGAKDRTMTTSGSRNGPGSAQLIKQPALQCVECGRPSWSGVHTRHRRGNQRKNRPRFSLRTTTAPQALWPLRGSALFAPCATGDVQQCGSEGVSLKRGFALLMDFHRFPCGGNATVVLARGQMPEAVAIAPETGNRSVRSHRHSRFSNVRYSARRVRLGCGSAPRQIICSPVLIGQKCLAFPLGR